MNALPSFVCGLTIGPPRGFERLTIFPLFHSYSAPLSYRTLDEAISNHTLRISELSLEGQFRTSCFAILLINLYSFSMGRNLSAPNKIAS